MRNRNKQSAPTVKIRPTKYDELKELWEKINQKYIIFFNQGLNQKIENEFHLVKGTFDFVTVSSSRSKVEVAENGASVAGESGVQYELHGKVIPYNEFLKRINKATSLPIKLIHAKVTEYFKENPPFTDPFINESSMNRFISQFNDWKVENIKGLLNYQKANYNSNETSLTDINGTLRKEIAQGLVGVSLEKGNPNKNYLYESIAYDSDLEKTNIISEIEDVVVFGKIPRRSIAIPTIIGNYSPDFMYVVKKKDGSKELNLIIETKDVKGKSHLPPVDQIKIDCAERFFEQLQIDGYEVKFETQINNKAISQIVKELME